MPKNYRTPGPATNVGLRERELVLTVTSRDRQRPYDVDFKRWLYVGRPTSDAIGTEQGRAGQQQAARNQLVEALFKISCDAKEHLLGHTLGEYLRTGLRIFFEYLDYLIVVEGKTVRCVSDIDRAIMINFANYLQHQTRRKKSDALSAISMSSMYKSAANLLRRLSDAGIVPRDVFPKNPFPGVARAQKSENIPYTDKEMQRIVVALNNDLAAIREHTFPVRSPNYSLAVYFALIAAYTGLNTTPLAELSVQAITPNPLSDKLMLLTTIKRRKGPRKMVEHRKRPAKTRCTALSP